jgi:hypothetical protein
MGCANEVLQAIAVFLLSTRLQSFGLDVMLMQTP